MSVNRRGFLGRIGKLGAAGAAIAAVGLPVVENETPPAYIIETEGSTLLSLPELGPTLQQIRAIVPEADLSEEQASYIQFGLQRFGTAKVYFKGYVDEVVSAGVREVRELAGLEPLKARVTLSSDQLNWDGTTLTKGLLK